MNSRQSYWEAVLRAEGLAPIEFAARGFVESSADHHREMTDDERPHWVDAEQLSKLAEIIREYRLPVTHRIILTALVDGHPIRAAARFAAVNKDKAHRIVLRYLRVERSTNAELHDLPLEVSTDPRRMGGRRRMSEAEATREGARRGLERPPSGSDLTQAYFANAKAYLEVASWVWMLDRDVWAAHAAGNGRERIARELGLPPGTVLRSIRRTRKEMIEWLRQRNEALSQQKEDE